MIQLTIDKFEELYKKGYDADIIFFLDFVNSGVYEFFHPKLLALEQTCKRKGLLSEQGKLTVEGEELLKFCSSTGEKPKLTRKKAEKVVEGFDLWWKTYPGTDTFEWKGKKFKGSRALRVKKDDCRTKISAILNEKEHTMEQLIDALKLEIFQKKEASIKSNSNKMSYFQNSLTYLTQRTFEPYVELVKAGHKTEEESKHIPGGVEI